MLRDLLMQFLTEVRQTLISLPGIDLDSYSTSIVRRFSNPAIRDQVARICSNGCAKMAKFIVPSLKELLGAGIQPKIIPVVLAAWLRYAAVRDGSANTEDPAIETLRPFLSDGGSDARLALREGSLFGDLAEVYPWIVAAVQHHLDNLRSRDACSAIEEALARTSRER